MALYRKAVCMATGPGWQYENRVRPTAVTQSEETRQKEVHAAEASLQVHRDAKTARRLAARLSIGKC
jgi:hypothetical protein